MNKSKGPKSSSLGEKPNTLEAMATTFFSFLVFQHKLACLCCAHVQNFTCMNVTGHLAGERLAIVESLCTSGIKFIDRERQILEKKIYHRLACFHHWLTSVANTYKARVFLC